MYLNICLLYPDLMNTYGDSGNLLSLEFRLKQRGITYKVLNFSLGSPLSILKEADLFLMGGAEDRQQEIVAKDLSEQKQALIHQRIQNQVPGLFICGAFQFLGKYYQVGNKKLKGLNIAKHYTQTETNKPRLIGEIVTKICHPKLVNHPLFQTGNHCFLIGFENHGGRTYLNSSSEALATVQQGFGNNNRDLTEGVVINHCLGTYLHGPILPRNPALSDYLIEKALEIKYNQPVVLKPINDDDENRNRVYLLKKLNVKAKN